MSIQNKIVNLLKSGRQYTPAQMAGMLKTTEATVRARVSDLRRAGVAITNGTTKTGKFAYRSQAV